ncbi:MAG: metallophosphoesterase family protein [Actinomycetota bacterium]
MAIRATRVAALYDIHGNLSALEAVLAEVDALGVDLVVVGGDIASGPLPLETLGALRSRGDARFVRGNADRELAVGAPPPESEGAQAAWTWTTSHLDDEQRTWLDGLGFSLTVEVGGLGSVLFCHGSPRSDEEIITRLSPDERVSPMLRDVAESVIVCGHTHIQFDRTIDGRRVVNAGSVGMSYQDEPGAYWMLISNEIEFRRTEYDLDEAAALITATGFPESDELIEILRRPPSSEEASTHFERMAVDRAQD